MSEFISKFPGLGGENGGKKSEVRSKKSEAGSKKPESN
jgi:hypothetical protein